MSLILILKMTRLSDKLASNKNNNSKSALNNHDYGKIIFKRNNGNKKDDKFANNFVEHTKKSEKLSKLRKLKSKKLAKSKKLLNTENLPNFSAKEADQVF